MATKDSASLAALFPLGTTGSDVLDRLRLYERRRKGRVGRIQEFTRKNGRDYVSSGESRPSRKSFQALDTLMGGSLIRYSL